MTFNAKWRVTLLRQLQKRLVRFCSSKQKSPIFPEPPDPLSCCGSGCQNCVWIEYASDVAKYFDQHPQGGNLTAEEKESKVQRLLKDNVKDPNLRAYLSIEVKMKM